MSTPPGTSEELNAVLAEVRWTEATIDRYLHELSQGLSTSLSAVWDVQ